MGAGILTGDGSDPLTAWRLRLQNFGSAQLSEVLQELLSGRPVTSEDGVLEISALPLSGGGGFRISVVLPGAPYVADLVVSASAGGHDPDPRSPFPPPDRWRSEIGESQVRWELFNCTCITLRSRTNAVSQSRSRTSERPPRASR